MTKCECWALSVFNIATIHSIFGSMVRFSVRGIPLKCDESYLHDSNITIIKYRLYSFALTILHKDSTILKSQLCLEFSTFLILAFYEMYDANENS